jgi:hypothetical protein
MKAADEIEFPGWRAWLTNGRFLVMLIGAVITLAVWAFAPPGWTQVTAVLYVAASLAYAVRDGWAPRWAIPITAAVAGFFVLSYLRAGKAAAMSVLHAHTSLPTTTLVALIVWAVLASVIVLVLDRKLQQQLDDRK